MSYKQEIDEASENIQKTEHSRTGSITYHIESECMQRRRTNSNIFHIQAFTLNEVCLTAK